MHKVDYWSEKCNIENVCHCSDCRTCNMVICCASPSCKTPTDTSSDSQRIVDLRNLGFSRTALHTRPACLRHRQNGDQRQETQQLHAGPCCASSYKSLCEEWTRTSENDNRMSNLTNPQTNQTTLRKKHTHTHTHTHTNT